MKISKRIAVPSGTTTQPVMSTDYGKGIYQTLIATFLIFCTAFTASAQNTENTAAIGTNSHIVLKELSKTVIPKNQVYTTKSAKLVMQYTTNTGKVIEIQYVSIKTATTGTNPDEKNFVFSSSIPQGIKPGDTVEFNTLDITFID